MTVAELIAELQKLPPDTHVVAFAGRYEDGSYEKADGITLVEWSKFRSEWPEGVPTDKPYVIIEA